MKHSIIAAALFFLGSNCSNKDGEKSQVNNGPTQIALPADSGKKNNVLTKKSKNESLVENEFGSFTQYELTEAMLEDFNGDKIRDTVRFQVRNGKAGLVVIDGKTAQETLIGCGNPFEEMGDDFSWVDEWGIVRDPSTYEVIIRGDEIVGEREVLLDYPSIYLRKAEVGGGVITFKGNTFQWIHQSD